MNKKITIPEGSTEDEVLAAIEKAVTILAPSFVFGYYDLEDIKQQARLFGLQALDRFDTSRPLANFVYTHIRNRLINLRRDKLRRNDPPCLSCHTGAPCNSGSYCRRYSLWLNRNNAKASLARPLDIDNVSDERERRTQVAPSAEVDAEINELVALINEHLPVELREDYLRMKDGIAIPRARRAEILDAIRLIVGEDLLHE